MDRSTTLAILLSLVTVTTKLAEAAPTRESPIVEVLDTRHPLNAKFYPIPPIWSASLAYEYAPRKREMSGRYFDLDSAPTDWNFNRL